MRILDAMVSGIMKHTQFEEIQEHIAKVFQNNRRAAIINDYHEIWYQSYEEWNDAFEVIYVDDSAAKASLKILSNVSSEYDSDYVYVGDFADAIDLSSEFGTGDGDEDDEE